MGKILLPFMIGSLLLTVLDLSAQGKKPLDHTVYDSWQNVGARSISNDGKWLSYQVDVQEGDGELVLQSSDTHIKKIFPRGTACSFSDNSKVAVFIIKAPYQFTRDVKNKKLKAEDVPKDTLVIWWTGTDSLMRIARVKSFILPEENANWMAWHMEKVVDTSKASKAINNNVEEGTELTILDLNTGKQRSIKDVSIYKTNKKGEALIMRTTPIKKDSLSLSKVLLWRYREDHVETLMQGVNDVKQLSLDESGKQAALLAERDSSSKSLQKFHKLWYWKNGMDTMQLLVHRKSTGMPLGWSPSENGSVYFSKNGQRLFMGLAPVVPPKDTTVPEAEQVKLDIWHYQDETLQTQQLFNLSREQKRTYLAVYDLEQERLLPLANENVTEVIVTDEGNGNQFLGISDKAYRNEIQWVGRVKRDIYSIDPSTGKQALIRKAHDGPFYISTKGRYVVLYDLAKKQYLSHVDAQLKNISSGAPFSFSDEQDDHPDLPESYGIAGWWDEDKYLWVYDRYDIWQLDPLGKEKPLNVTQNGRSNKLRYRLVNLNPEQKNILAGDRIALSTFNETTKQQGYAFAKAGDRSMPQVASTGSYAYKGLIKSRNANVYAYTKENFKESPDLYVNPDFNRETRLTRINPQQSQYIWGTVELYEWVASDGKKTQGLLYKPENFDPKKKYPVILYFYERLSDNLFNYSAPAPVRSAINPSFFTSNGYIVLMPDIRYTIGYPGKSAEIYVISAAKSIAQKPWVNAKRIGIQGHSWGGYQVAHLITRTNMFRAAWSGAPVSNMTSAYGGIRYESGLNRQFQYEKTQSRLGKTLWENRQLYIENSPQFYLDKVNTPVAILHNDADGAVPFTQGIEMFTGLKRLGKPAWLLNYNGEAHGVMQRHNRKDMALRQQQFFDWLLKDEKPATWLKEGVPAIMKGRDLGLGIDE